MRVRGKPRNKKYKEILRNKVKNAKVPNTYADKSNESESRKQDKKSQKKNEKSTNINKKTVKPAKSYSKFKAFLKEIIFDSNYQFVMLKSLLEYGELYLGQIAESLAYFNNRDSSDIVAVKSYFDVLSFDVLLDHKFIIELCKSNGLLFYSLNVQLDEFQKIELIDYLSAEITKFNQKYDIPKNVHPHANNINNIDWNYHHFKNNPNIKKIENLVKNSSFVSRHVWMWSITPVNWEIIKSKHVWGSKLPKEKIGSRVCSGDQVAFYVVGTNTFQGIFEFVGDWFDSSGSLWDDDLKFNGSPKYRSRINLKPVQLGTAAISDLCDKMELFIGKPQYVHSFIFLDRGGYPSNNNKPLLENDFKIIKEHLVKNMLTDVQTTRQTDSKNVKECLKCHTRVENPFDPIFEHLVEEIFGHVQSDPGDPQTKKLQLYCRACVANFGINWL